jgi:hypothetical protein
VAVKRLVGGAERVIETSRRASACRSSNAKVSFHRQLTYLKYTKDGGKPK